MDSENIVCPVCTLFLRPGITLKAHLSSHPKQKVIEALVRISSGENETKTQASTSNQNENLIGSTNTITSNNQAWNSPSMPVNTVYPNFSAMPGNHSFIYQQFMSSSTPPPNVLNVNPLTQQFVTVPTVFNSQMMCPPYVYQQQQVIMSSGPSVMSIVQKPLPIELPTSPNQENRTSTSEIDGDDQVDLIDEPELVTIEISELNKSEEENLRDKEGNTLELDKVETEISEIKENTDYKIDVSPNKIMQGNTIITSSNIARDISEDPIEDCIKDSECESALTEVHDSEQEYSVECDVDLNKSCQTQTVNNFGEVAVDEEEEVIEIQNEPENKPGCYYAEVQESITNTNYTILQNSYEQAESTYTSTHAESLFASRSHEQNTASVIDMDGMNLFINSDFLNNHLVSQVDEFECANNERPRIILNLGGMDNNYISRDNNDESLSRESANIRTDEHMPPRGELSGQESNGATSDVNWNRVQYQEVCSTYDLIARENWNDDISDSEPNSAPNQAHNQISNCDDDTPTVSGFREPPITYKCPTCGESFNCPKERRVHQRAHHSIAEKRDKEIGGQIGGKRVKKLTIKPKRNDIKTENNFDNVFTNKLKLESNNENDKCDVMPQTNEIEVQKKEDVAISNPNICTVCDMVVADNNALKQHQLEAHNLSSDIRHKCKTCEQTFPNESKYTEHLRTHPLECRLCGKYFYRKQNMQLHMKRHLGIKPFKCNICEKAFLTKQKHDEHKNIHTGDTPIKCNMCDETFRRHSNLVQHRNRHHFNMKRKMKDYVCFCGEIFHSKRKLAWHKEIHDPKPKACSHCSEKFIHMSSLTRHIRRAHNERFLPNKERVSENVECPICKGVYLRSYLEVHIRNHSGHKPFNCLICNKGFTTKWNLKLHKWTHASRTAKPFKCDLCKGAFIRESDYTAHMNAHKSVKPYTCNYCGAQFIRKYNCQRHVKEHEKVKTFSCQVCGKSFHRSYYLKDHIRVHSGVRPYTCHICGKTSTTKSNHNKHVRIHHAREPVSTEN
ncbi:hypothetical protein Trydic_g6396 [Trypoxylus dichotomus]